jgi:glycosyltransferase involved in cell wall biosynthesis
MNESPGPELKQNTLLVATDVPYWRQQTGAQQRILGLVQFLTSRGWQITTAYIGSFESQTGTGKAAGSPDKHQIRQLGLTVVSLIEDWKPQGLVESLTWRVKCILNLFSSRRSSKLESASPSKILPEQSRRLVDFQNSELRRRFQQLTQVLRPSVAIVEYLTLSYLVPARQKRDGVRFWIDTHDLLSSRCAQFRQRGWLHWIDITEAEEAEALNHFDGIIAIEESEAEHFRSLTENRLPVVVAGYAPAAVHPTSDAAKPAVATTDSEIAIGMIASENAINSSGLEWFLSEVWPRLNQHSEPAPTAGTNTAHNIRLVLAGSICSSPVVLRGCGEQVTCLGTVECLNQFYDRIQIALNPIQFGTGLKIKSAEALSFGKPLIATRHAVIGLPRAGQGTPFISCNHADEMVAAILQLAESPSQRQAMSDSAKQYASRYLQPETVYGKLLEKLESR